MAELGMIIKHLRDEVGLSGYRGQTISEIWALADNYRSREVVYRVPFSFLSEEDNADDTETEPFPRAPLDAHTKEQIWSLIQSDKDILIGKYDEGRGLGLQHVEDGKPPSPEALNEAKEKIIKWNNDTAKSHFRKIGLNLWKNGDNSKPDAATEDAPGEKVGYEWKIYGSTDTIWTAITGHGEDFSKISPKLWEILLVVAATRENGIDQIALTNATGQDKRSLPKRTDQLAAMSYVTKEKVSVKSSRTSLLALSRFSKSGDSESPHATKLRDLSASTVVEDIIKTLKEARNGVLLWIDLKKKVSLNESKFQARVFRNRVVRLSEMGIVQRIRVPNVENAAANKDDTIGEEDQASQKSKAGVPRSTKKPAQPKCVKFIRDLASGEMEQALQKPNPRFMFTKREGEVILALKTIEEATETDADIEDANVKKILPRWAPRTFGCSIFDVIEEHGVSGILSPDLFMHVTGPFAYRSFDRLLNNLIDRGGVSPQRPSLEDIVIVRDMELVGKSATYRYWSYKSFVDFCEQNNLPERLADIKKIKEGLSNGPGKKRIILNEFGFDNAIISNYSIRPGFETFLEKQNLTPIRVIKPPEVNTKVDSKGRKVFCWKKLGFEHPLYRPFKNLLDVPEVQLPAGKPRGRPRKPGAKRRRNPKDQDGPRKKGRPLKPRKKQRPTGNPRGRPKKTAKTGRANPTKTKQTKQPEKDSTQIAVEAVVADPIESAKPPKFPKPAKPVKPAKMVDSSPPRRSQRDVKKVVRLEDEIFELEAQEASKPATSAHLPDNEQGPTVKRSRGRPRKPVPTVVEVIDLERSQENGSRASETYQGNPPLDSLDSNVSTQVHDNVEKRKASDISAPHHGQMSKKARLSKEKSRTIEPTIEVDAPGTEGEVAPNYTGEATTNIPPIVDLTKEAKEKDTGPVASTSPLVQENAGETSKMLDPSDIYPSNVISAPAQAPAPAPTLAEPSVVSSTSRLDSFDGDDSSDLNRYIDTDGIELELLKLGPAPPPSKRVLKNVQESREQILSNLVQEFDNAIDTHKAYELFRERFRAKHGVTTTTDRKTFQTVVDTLTRKGKFKQIMVSRRSDKGLRSIGKLIVDAKFNIKSDRVLKEKAKLLQNQDTRSHLRHILGRSVVASRSFAVEDISYDRIYPTVRQQQEEARNARKQERLAAKEAKLAKRRNAIENLKAATDREEREKVLARITKAKSVKQKENEKEKEKEIEIFVPYQRKYPFINHTPFDIRFGIVSVVDHEPDRSSDDEENSIDGRADLNVTDDVNFRISGYSYLSEVRKILKNTPAEENKKMPPSAPPPPRRRREGAARPVKRAQNKEPSVRKKTSDSTRTRQRAPRGTKSAAKRKNISGLSALRGFRRSKGAVLGEIENVFKRDIAGRQPRHRRQGFANGFDDDRVMQAIIISRSLFGGLSRNVNWEVVQKAFSGRTQDDIARRWARVRYNRRVQIQTLQQEFDQAYIEAFEGGTVPLFDRSHPENFDIDWHIEWFERTIALPQVDKVLDLPEDRSVFDSEFSYKLPHSDDWRSELQNSVIAAQHRRENMLGHVLSIPLHPSRHVESEYGHIKRAIKSVMLTEPTAYENELAMSFIDSQPEEATQKAFEELWNEKLVIKDKFSARKLNFSINKFFMAKIKTAMPEEACDQALMFDKKARDDFEAKGHSDVAELLTSGTMVWIIDMLMDNKVKLEFGETKFKHKPMGLLDSYTSRGMDPLLYQFDIALLPSQDFHKVPSFRGGNINNSNNNNDNNNNLRIPLGSLQNLERPLNLWQDSNEQLISHVWGKMLKAVLGVIILRPGTKVEDIIPILGPAVTENDVIRVLQYLIARKAVKAGQCKGFLPGPRYFYAAYSS